MPATIFTLTLSTPASPSVSEQLLVAGPVLGFGMHGQPSPGGGEAENQERRRMFTKV